MGDDGMESEREGEDGSDDADGEGSIDRGPPTAMNTGVADEDEETDTEEELGNSGEVQASRTREKRHDGGVNVERRKDSAKLKRFVLGWVGPAVEFWR